MVSPQEFLRNVWGDAKGFAELTAIGKRGDLLSFPFQYPDSLESLVGAARNHNKHRNVYFGVAIRRERWPRPALDPKTGRQLRDPKTGKPKFEGRGTEENAHSVRCCWVDLDFAGQGHKGKVIERAEARKRLKELPLQPSIVVMTGGGIQVYWLLHEPVHGEELWTVKARNIQLKKLLGGDPTADLARIFRLPGSENVKYTPRRPCDVVYWKPDRLYSLDDFDAKLGPANVEEVKPVALTTGMAAPREIPSAGRRGIVTHLSSDVVDQVKKLLAEIWPMGYRHRMALYFGGLCAHAGVPCETATNIVQAVSDFKGGDSRGRVKDVEDTYARFEHDHKIAGGPAMEKMIVEEFEPPLDKGAKKVFDLIRKAIPKPPGGPRGGGREEVDPDFDIIRVIKFDSRPARYHVTIQKHDEEEEFTVECETPIFSVFNRFHQAFIEATPNRVLAPITNRRWHLLIQAAALEIREAPEEARISGAIANELETFIDNRKENPELGELAAYAGYDDDAIYFSLSTLKKRLRDRDIRPSDQQLMHTLKDLGWDTRRQTFGERKPRVWYKALVESGGNGNGNGHGNGHDQGGLFPEAS